MNSSSSPPEFWREYRTFAHPGHDWNIHETTVQRKVERVETALIGSGEFRLPGRKSLNREENVFQIIAVDAAETPCARPTRQQRRWYSGKKKRHTLKTQVVIDVSTRMILCVATAFGSMHDLTLFRPSGVRAFPLDGERFSLSLWVRVRAGATAGGTLASVPPRLLRKVSVSLCGSRAGPVPPWVAEDWNRAAPAAVRQG